jgi:hypothetical protein
MNFFLAAVLIGSLRAAAMDVFMWEADKAMRISAAFETSAPCPTAWAVLTDYDGLPRFIRSMQRSRARYDGDILIVEQKARSGYLIAGKTMSVRLRVEETPMSSIEFVDLTGEDFNWYSGSWSLSPFDEGCTVRYDLRAELRSTPPRWLRRAVAGRDVRRLLEDVRGEMERRR